MDVSVAEAAEALGVSPRRVRALAEAGESPARRVGRVWVIDLDPQAAAAPSRPAAVGPFGLGGPRAGPREPLPL